MKFSSILSKSKSFKEVLDTLGSHKTPLEVYGLSAIHKVILTSYLFEKLNKTICLITPDEFSAIKAAEDLSAIFDYENIYHFPVKDVTFSEMTAESHEYEYQRLGVLFSTHNKPSIIVSSAESALEYTISPEKLYDNVFVLTDKYNGGFENFLEKLINAGYNRESQVEGACTFSSRGGIIDFWPAGNSNPVRVEFWGDEVNSMAYFSSEDQRRIAPCSEIAITPCKEVFSENTLLDHIDKDAVIILSDAISIKENLNNAQNLFNEDLKAFIDEGKKYTGPSNYMASFDVLMCRVADCDSILANTFSRSLPDFKIRARIGINGTTIASWGGELSLLTEDIRNYLADGYKICVLLPTAKGCETLKKDLVSEGFSDKQVEVIDLTISSGFELTDDKIVVISHTRTAAPRKAKRRKTNNGIRSLSDLRSGDYVVHVSHGIGIFDGIVEKTLNGVTKDYIKIKYAGKDVLFVPVTQMDLVSKYIGKSEDGIIKLSRLGSPEWQKTKTKVKAATKQMAEELTALYKKRLAATGFAFSPDNDWQRDFELRFPYEETDDQLRCISEIKEDMQSKKPMDRLLCGDVGFGKTEVALRAAFKCVLDGKQCAVLVPTTILAWQHYQTFSKRMEGFPIKIELLSRFRTAKQQNDIIKKLATGEIDIVIGTHRLIQKDVKYKDLGLCIIDEEQRFGVAHKEKFKELREEVDVLTLSATPIPRTLSMAMSGIRDMSIIEEAPQNRHPVQTYVMEYDSGIIAEAIKKELRRGGQIFYLHNRVLDINRCAFHLGEMLPEAKIAIAHGKMPEEEISSIWQKLIDHEIDVLVCTTIIESGIDVPNCNTLIIEDADKMGLSQLYQLRGRVGRSPRRAFAYFTFRPDKVLTEISEKRLSAIKEFTSFGSGFHIAMRDMEIRGAGSVLGGEQHGHMEAVGYEMYLRLLSESVSEAKGEPIKKTSECMVDIKIDAHIPEDYIPDLSQRLDVYKKIAAVSNENMAADVLDELIDRFGDVPDTVGGLIDVSLIRNRAANLGIKEISQRNQNMLFYLENNDPILAATIATRFPKRVLFNAGEKPYISICLQNRENPIDLITDVLSNIKE